jgi:hypothetical protein
MVRGNNAGRGGRFHLLLWRARNTK